jgi:restriction endonuclease S subunit
MTNWPVKTLGEVTELLTGGTPSTGEKSYYDGGQIKWLRSGDVHQREIYDCEGRITEEGMRNANTRYLPLNSVLIALAGQGKTRGTVAMLRTQATCNQSVVSIMPTDLKTLLPEFVFWNLHMKYDEIRRMTGDDGNDRRGLNMRLIRSMTVPIAPLEEQMRIVALLDNTSARITELTACYEQARTHANNLLTSALRDALEGNPDWPVQPLGDVCLEIERRDPKESKLPEFTYIDLSAINQQTKQIDAARILATIDAPGRARQVVQMSDVLVSTVRPNLNAVALVGSDLDAATASTGFCVLRPNQSVVEPGLLFAWVRNQSFIDELTAQAKGASYPAVTDSIVKSLQIPIPPLEEQERIVARLDQLRAKTAEMVAAYDAKLQAAKNLRQSILEAAFAGEL